MDDSLKEKLLSKDKWLRVLFMIAFAIAGNFVQYIVWFIAVIQVVLTLVTGSPNQNLVRLGQGLSAFAYHIMRYLTYNVEEKPYPFTPWSGSHKESE